MAFSMVSSFRMHATMITLGGLPLAVNRSDSALMSTLCRLAVTVAMYSMQRT